MIEGLTRDEAIRLGEVALRKARALDVPELAVRFLLEALADAGAFNDGRNMGDRLVGRLR